jgi:dienelactone hydrolase
MGRLRRTVRVGRNRNRIRTGIEPHELSAKLNHKLPLHLESLDAELVMVGKVRVLGWSLGGQITWPIMSDYELLESIIELSRLPPT